MTKNSAISIAYDKELENVCSSCQVHHGLELGLWIKPSSSLPACSTIFPTSAANSSASLYSPSSSFSTWLGRLRISTRPHRRDASGFMACSGIFIGAFPGSLSLYFLSSRWKRWCGFRTSHASCGYPLDHQWQGCRPPPANPCKARLTGCSASRLTVAQRHRRCLHSQGTGRCD